MAEKRYSIIRADNICPEYVEDFKCHFPDNSVECMKCNHHRYGDTKEQLVMKVAQVIAKCRLEKETNGIMYSWEDEARKIIEFLGIVE